MRRILTPHEEAILAGLSEVGDFRSLARQAADAANAACERETCHVLVVSGARSFDEQFARWAEHRYVIDGADPKLRKSWRVQPGKKPVTYSWPGSSAHNFGLALDLALIYDDAQAWLDDKDPRWGEILGYVVRSTPGLRWGGDFQLRDSRTGELCPFFDAAHLELLGWAGAVREMRDQERKA